MYTNIFEYLLEDDILVNDDNGIDYDSYYNEDYTVLTFPNKFNDSIQNTEFVDTLEHINFGKKFCKSLKNVKFPSSVKSIKFGKKYNLSIDSVELPENLESLEFGECFTRPINNLPPALKKIIFYQITNTINNLPCTLESIIIRNDPVLKFRVEHMEEIPHHLIKKIPHGCSICVEG